MAQNKPAGVNDYVYPGMIEVREEDSISEAMASAQGDISNPIARDILPNLDLDEGDEESAWDGEQPYWIQFSGATDAGEYTVYEIDSDTGRAERRVIAIYGFEVVEGGEFVNVVRFRGSDDQVFERAQVQGLDETGDNPVDRQSTLRSPVLFDVQDNGSIAFEVEELEEAEDEVRIKLLGVTVEKQGRRVGSRS